jgi:hypothetical protein
VGFLRRLNIIQRMQAGKTKSAGPEPARRAGDERLRVRRWRREQFIGLGFSLSEAVALARSAADLHEARKLISCGCAHATALRIMR